MMLGPRKILFSLSFLSFWISFFALNEHREFFYQSGGPRVPASADFTCFQLQKRLFGQEKKQALQFDEDLYQRELNYFKSRSHQVDWTEFERPEKLESLLAFAHSREVLGTSDFHFHSLRLKQQKGLASLAKKISQGRAFIWRDIEEMTAELIMLKSTGASQRLFQSLNVTSKRKLINRLVQEELTSNGLLAFYPKFQLFRGEQQAFRRFKESKLGQIVFTGFLNLPVLSGFPPLFLPSFKKPRLSPELLQSILESGLTESRYLAIEEELGTQLHHLSFKERYEIFRRYYMVAAGVATTLMIIHQTYEADQVLQAEGLILAEFEEDLGELLDDMESLQSEGYQIFQDDELRHPACLSIERCQNNGEFLDLCRTLFDRRNLCQEFFINELPES